MTYLPSVWISNLGVDPLLRLVAFLLDPIFFFLLALLASVCLVRETINPLPGINNQLHKVGFVWLENLKEILVPKSAQLVKILSLLGLIFSSNQILATELDRTILLSIGEMQEIELARSASFSIGNSDTLGHKYLNTKERLLIKGKKLGFSEIIIWQKGSTKKKSIKVHVIERRKHLAAIKTLSAFESLGLKTEVIGDFLRISGTLNTIVQYRQFHQLRAAAGEGLLLTGELTRELKLLLIGHAYEIFHRFKLKQFRCYTINFDFICRTPSIAALAQDVLAQLKDHTFVKIIETNQKRVDQNFQLKLKLIQLEALSGSELSFGLDNLSSNLAEIFDNGLTSLIRRNQVLINDLNLDLSTLAEPTGLIRVGHPAEFKIGAEIPYQAQVNLENGVSSKEWKFVGLKIKVTLEREAGHYIVYYQTEFTSPGAGQDEFSGNSESSTAIINLGSPTDLFQIGMKTINIKESSLPVLSKIPLLGALFRSKGKVSTHKKISGIILLEAHETVSSK